MQPWMKDVPAAVVRVKAELKERVPDAEARFRTLSTQVEREVAAVREEARGGGAVPELHYQDLAAGHVPGPLADRIRRRGCAVVRGVFPNSRIAAWNDEIGEYVERNRYAEKQKSRAGLDKYFATLSAASPQIYSLYWSKPQVLARQSDELARVRTALNRLWHQPAEAPAFDAARECTYADRLRRRQPGDKTLGLSPHADGGSVERWCDPSYQRVYREVLFGDPTRYDPFEATHRVTTEEIPSPAVCSVFRSFQGWTALSQQGPGDGTLQLIPIANLMSWILVRALQPDVAPDDLCGARAGKALPFDPARWHTAAAQALVTIPRVQPGDTVWWHNDLIHAVEGEHRGTTSSNVIYIGGAPFCPKNAAFLPRQAEAFRLGKSCPDFAAEDYEVDFEGRATEADLSRLGRRQMGLEPW